jgi:hypothetical protein
MRRLSLACFVLSLGSCEERRAADIGLVMSAPEGLLDEASAVRLHVFPADGRACRDDGSASELPGSAQKFQLSKSGCEGGATWCGEITLERDESTQMFYAEVTGAGELVAQGCATAAIDQDPVEVDIKVLRVVPPACCGNGTLEVGELCDTGPPGGACGTITADAVCDADCSAREIPIDYETQSAGPLGQTTLSLTFASGTGQLDGALRAVWQTSSSDTSDVGLRYLLPDLNPVTMPAGIGEPHRLTYRCNNTETPLNRRQRTPSVAPLGSGVVVAFVSNFTTPLRNDVQAQELPGTGCNNDLPLNVSDTMAAVDALDVDVAGSGNTALVVWEQNGQILGRPFAAGATQASLDVTPPFTISAGRTPRVAASAGGWVVVYQGADAGDDDGVFARRVSATLSVGGPRLVNQQAQGTQDQPEVGALSDGRYAVAWRSAGDIFFQRFGADDAPVGGDQDAPLNTTTEGDQAAPSVGGAGEFFAIAWENGAEIRSRFVGANGGFLFNNVSGQNDDFGVTRAAVAPRRPAVTAGGFVVYGWEDQASAAPGMYVRRFPIPN